MKLKKKSKNQNNIWPEKKKLKWTIMRWINSIRSIKSEKRSRKLIGDYTRSGDLAVILFDERSDSSDLRTERERRSPKDAVTPSVNGGTGGVSGGGWGESRRSNRRRTRERWREGSREREEFGTCCSERSHGYENRACENENGSGVWLTNECELG